MSTDYDAIAGDYQQAKRQPWRTAVEAYTLSGLVGDLAGKAAVDLACGDGHYTRFLRKQGALRVLGVDLSEGMIALARREEARDPLGIDYLVQDGRNLNLAEEFDLTIAAYLLNYARDRHELLAMCQGIARSLKPGGRFVSVNTNPCVDFRALPSYRRYGFEASVADGELREGTPITWTFHLEQGSIQVENYYLDRETHEWAFRTAGLHDLRWHPPRLSPGSHDETGRDYWADLLNHPPVIFIECVKADTASTPRETVPAEATCPGG